MNQPASPDPSSPRTVSGISHLLLDIEGTTCPVSFVSDVLFPYARRNLAAFLESHRQSTELEDLVTEIQAAWHDDPDPEAQALRLQQADDVVPYLQWLIDHDRKLSALKELQGLIWRQGYQRGELIGPLFADVPAALQRWHRDGIVLSSYSSGSMQAQQLLYGHCQVGDLRPLFQHWFDTRTGPKQDQESYRAIAAVMDVPCHRVLFISDAITELEAADAAGMMTGFSDRVGNPARQPGRFPRIHDYSSLQLLKP